MSKTRGGKPKGPHRLLGTIRVPRRRPARKPSASVVLRNHAGELLLLRRADNRPLDHPRPGGA